MAERIKSFEEFWPYYLNEHSKPLTRAIHLAGTAAGIALLGAAVVTGQWWLPLAGLAAGYGSAWTAHAFVEKNKPATFTYPAWSLRGDFKMLKHFVTGTLGAEVKKHVTKKPEPQPATAAVPGKSLVQRVKGLKQSFAKAFAAKTPAASPKPAPQAPKAAASAP
jgi:hypothetical protein